MLNKFCHELGFSEAGWPCNNVRERVLQTLVHHSANVTHIKGFMQIDFFSLHTTMHQSEVGDRGEKTTLYSLCTATGMGKIVVGAHDVQNSVAAYSVCGVFTFRSIFFLLCNYQPVTKTRSTTQD